MREVVNQLRYVEALPQSSARDALASELESRLYDMMRDDVAQIVGAKPTDSQLRQLRNVFMKVCR